MKKLLFLMLTATTAFAQDITRTGYSPDLAGVVLVNDNTTAKGNRSFSYCGARPVSNRRYLVLSNLEHQTYRNQPSYAKTFKIGKTTYTEKSVEVNLLFSGFYVIEAANLKVISKKDKEKYQQWLSDPILGTTEGREPFLRLHGDSQLSTWKADIQQNKFEMGGAYFKPSAKQLQEWESKNVSLAEAKSNLTEKFARADFNVHAVGFALRSGEVVPIALVQYGTKQKLYAMYGIFGDPTVSGKYGFGAVSPVNRVYISERTLVDPKLWLDDDYMTGSPYKMGTKAYSYNDVVANVNNIQDSLAWRAGTYPVHSNLPKEYSPQGDMTSRYFLEVPPNTPDGTDNTNPIGCQDCPDQDFYWKLYVDCIKEKFDDYNAPVNPAKYMDYTDYMSISMNTQTYDPTFYHEDGSISPKFVSPDNQPVEPYIFDKDGNLLNREPPTSYDIWHKDTRFSVRNLRLEWDGWHTNNIDVTSKTKAGIRHLRDVWESTLKKNSKAILEQSGFSVTLYDEYKDKDWYIGNPMDKYKPYTSGQNFVTFDEYYQKNGGHPLKLTTPKNDGKSATSYKDKKDAVIVWKWPLIWKDKYQVPYQAGYVTYKHKVMDDHENIMYAGQEHNDRKENRWISLTGTQMAKEPVEYDKNSKEARTEDASPHERDSEIAKDEARALILKKILVAEMLQLTMKTAYALGENNKVAAVAYEVGARVESNSAVKVTKKIAIEALKAYETWKRTMDAIAKVRDTYQNISAAWDGLLKTTQYIKEYYETLDWKKINPTNITQIFPVQIPMAIDWSLYRFQYSIADFNKSLHEMALLTDQISGANYGKLNMLINHSYSAIGKVIYETTEKSNAQSQELQKRLQEVEQKTDGTASDVAYLSNFTQAAHAVITNQRLRISNERTRALAQSLMIIEAESQDWVTWQAHMSQAYDLAKDLKNLPDDPQKKSAIISNRLTTSSVLWKRSSPEAFLGAMKTVYGE